MATSLFSTVITFIDIYADATLKLSFKKLKSAIIKTHGSESRGQEEAGLRDERVSYLQVAPL